MSLADTARRILWVEDIARIWGISEVAVRLRVGRGTFPVSPRDRTAGSRGRLYWSADDVDAYLATGKAPRRKRVTSAGDDGSIVARLLAAAKED